VNFFVDGIQSFTVVVPSHLLFYLMLRKNIKGLGSLLPETLLKA